MDADLVCRHSIPPFLVPSPVGPSVALLLPHRRDDYVHVKRFRLQSGRWKFEVLRNSRSSKR